MQLPLKILICHFADSSVLCYAVESHISPSDTLELLMNKTRVLFYGARKLNGSSDLKDYDVGEIPLFDLNLQRIHALTQFGQQLPGTILAMVGCPENELSNAIAGMKNRIMQFPGILDGTAKSKYAIQNSIDVFICHANTDKALALTIVDYFNSFGYSTWCYERNSLPGKPHLEQSGTAIQESKCVITLLSESAIKSEFVTQELYTAIQFNKDIVPVTIGMTHEELENQNIKWAKILGTTVSIEWDDNSTDEILGKLRNGVDGIISTIGRK